MTDKLVLAVSLCTFVNEEKHDTIYTIKTHIIGNNPLEVTENSPMLIRLMDDTVMELSALVGGKEMSRIGIRPITVPAGVEVTVDGNVVTVKGPKGQLTQEIAPEMAVELNDGTLTVKRPNDERKERSQHGLARTLINNMVVGVTQGFEKKLQLVGVGYKAEKKGDTLVLSLGYSHPVELKDPEGITTECPSQTEIVVKGIDKAFVGNYAADIRAWRKPEPYKGKGIKYADEVIRRKEGKAGAK